MIELISFILGSPVNFAGTCVLMVMAGFSICVGLSGLRGVVSVHNSGWIHTGDVLEVRPAPDKEPV